MAKKFKNSDIKKLFIKYVEGMQCKERHTKDACKSVDEFERICEQKFPDDYRLQSCLYGYMMDAAVDFEESGFIAGFKTAVKLLYNL